MPIVLLIIYFLFVLDAAAALAGDSLPVLGARGVVCLEPLAEREQALARQLGGRALAEPAHEPAAVGAAPPQLARPRRVPLHGAPHYVPDLQLPRRSLWRFFIGSLRPLVIYRSSVTLALDFNRAVTAPDTRLTETV